MGFKSVFDLIEYQRRYARKNRQKQKVKARKHYLKNRATYLLRSKKQRISNPEKMKEYDRLRYERKKEQVKKRMREYYKRNADRIKDRVRKHKAKNILEVREKQKITYNKYRLKYLAQRKRYYRRNRKELLIKSREWRRANREKILTGRARFFKKRPEAKVAHMLRLRLNKILGSQKPKNLSVFKLVGCSYETLRRHIEKQFKPGMSWGNRGKAWHIDHRIPISLFSKDELLAANHFSNLRPMFASSNISRGNRLKGYFVLRKNLVVKHSD